MKIIAALQGTCSRHNLGSYLELLRWAVNSGGLCRRDRVRHKFGWERRGGRVNLDADEVACEHDGLVLYHAYESLLAARNGDQRTDWYGKLNDQAEAARRYVDNLADLFKMSAALPPSDYD
jgi:hypothetical protein